jgi:hypothetical protein
VDEVRTGGGAAVGGDVSAKSVTGRDSYWSSSSNVQVSDALTRLQADILELKVDVRLFQNMAEERRIQLVELRGWVVMMGMAMIVQTIAFLFFVFVVWR